MRIKCQVLSKCLQFLAFCRAQLFKLPLSEWALCKNFTRRFSHSGSKRILAGLPNSIEIVWVEIGPILYYLLGGLPYIALLQLLLATVMLVGIRKGSEFLLTNTARAVGLRKRRKLSSTSYVSALLSPDRSNYSWPSSFLSPRPTSPI